MSLRPRSGAPNPARGGDGRRYRWSESPVPRPGVRRVRAAGVPLVLPKFVGMGAYSPPSSGTTLTWRFTDAAVQTGLSEIEGISTPTANPDPTDNVILYGFWDCAVTLPTTGWTLLDSGTTTNGLHYFVMYGDWGATSDIWFTRADHDVAGFINAWVFRGADAWGAPSAVVDSGTGTVATQNIPPASWAVSMFAMGVLAGYSNSGTWDPTYPGNDLTPELGYGTYASFGNPAINYDTIFHGYAVPPSPVDLSALGKDSGGPWPESYEITRTLTDPADWVAFYVGWA